jgi:hypothetical protein
LGRPVDEKVHPNPHPSDAKSIGDLKTEPELTSLDKYIFIVYKYVFVDILLTSSESSGPWALYIYKALTHSNNLFRKKSVLR